MYGEKAEEAEELKLDIQDLKSMYRQQVCVYLGQMKCPREKISFLCRLMNWWARGGFEKL